MEPDDEISLLDLLVVIAENWIWLVLVPLALGAATFIFLQMQPERYQAGATIAHPSTEIATFWDETVVEGAERPDVARASGPDENGLSITSTPGQPTDAGVTPSTDLSVTLPTAESARATLHAVLATIQQGLETGAIVRTQDRARDKITGLEGQIALRDKTIARLEQSLETLAGADPFDAETYASTANALGQLLAGRSADVTEYETLLAAAPDASADAVAEAPTSVDRLGQSPLVLTALVVLGSGFAMLILIFVRHGLRSAAGEPEARRKLDRIKNAFLLRRRR